MQIRNLLRAFAQQTTIRHFIGVAFLGLFVLVRIWDPDILEEVRLKTFDVYQQFHPREYQDLPVIIVDIDEASLSRFGQWPWPRDRLATLIDQLTQAGAAAIAFDVVFSEPDRTSPSVLADSANGYDDRVRAILRELPDHDASFAASIRASRVVVGQSAYHKKIVGREEATKIRTPFATLGPNPKSYLIRFPDLLSNIPELEAAALGRGVFSIVPEFDGLVRRVPLVVVADDMLVPALIVDLLRVATGGDSVLIRSAETGVQSIVVNRVTIPTDQFGRVWVHYTPSLSSRFLSAGDVLTGNVPSQKIAGKLVLIGTSAVGLLDQKATPIASSMPGVEVHAQLLETILAGTSLTRPQYATFVEIAFIIVVGLTMILLIPVRGALEIFFLGAVVAALAIAGSWTVFVNERLLFDVSYPLISLFTIYVSLVFVNYIREETQRNEIRSAFGHYLSYDLIEQLANDPEKLVLGGETKHMSVLFSDVRGFTEISEAHKSRPQELSLLINSILTPLSVAVIEQKGTIDKYMGDNIMAFWNAPLSNPDHAQSACTAALDMLRRLDRVNNEREAEAAANNQPNLPLKIGVGINTGECVVGNMGSDLRFDYTVLGDSVNLASRLEGQSKFYGRPIVIGETTARIVENAFALLELDIIQVKGKSEPERIFTILGENELQSDPIYQRTRDATDALLNAYRRQDWNSAEKALKRCELGSVKLGLTEFFSVYRERIAEFRINPPPPDWNGVFQATAK